ncbi:hypothetical protein [Mycobacterium canetti]|uniref:hypothetical protein n=1 Tax=Mycobacterium canetti TaxID=78331 RepID=UPI000349A0C3|nr:hypothetical protein [Mycobacterium canetti]
MTQPPDDDQPDSLVRCENCGKYGWHPTDQCPEQTSAPIDLDPPALPPAALLRWKELADRDIGVYHDGDASKVIPFERPEWADPDCDIVGRNLSQCYYTSEWVEIPLAYRDGHIDEEELEPAVMRVRAKMCGDGIAFVGLSERRFAKGQWKFSDGVGLTPTEATELARVLLAAVELIGGVPEVNR